MQTILRIVDIDDIYVKSIMIGWNPDVEINFNIHMFKSAGVEPKIGGRYIVEVEDLYVDDPRDLYVRVLYLAQPPPKEWFA